MSKGKHSTLKTVILFLLGTFVLALIPELIGEDIKKILAEKLGENYLMWIIGGGLLLGAIYLLLDNYKKKEDVQRSEEEILKDRKILLEGTLIRYKSRIKQKLVGNLAFEVNLELKYVNTKAKDAIHKKFIIKPQDNSIKDYDKLFNEYYRKIKRLIILGEPGSGKTMLLLRIAKRLIDQAKEDKNHPIPIIINLASWRNKETSFKDWLERQLPHSAGEGGISKDYAKRLMKGDQILPLLDGLDEIPEAHRDSCFKALNTYLFDLKNQRKSHQYPETIICSRIKEFHEVNEVAHIYASLSIQPLSEEKVREALRRLEQQKNIPASKLLSDFERRATLQQSLTTAFHVHTALSLYSNSWKEEKPELSKKTQVELQNIILDQYLDQETGKLDSNTKYKSSKTYKWLSWLAYMTMDSKKGVEFELADFQSDWLMVKQKNILYGLFLGLLYGISFSLISYPGFSLFNQISESLNIGIGNMVLLSLLTGLLMGLLSRTIKPEIIYDDITSWNFKAKKFSHIFNWSELKDSILSLIGWCIWSILWSLILGFKIGIDIGLSVGITLGISGVIGGINSRFLVNSITETKDFAKLNAPYQRITANLEIKIVRFSLFLILSAILAYFISRLFFYNLLEFTVSLPLYFYIILVILVLVLLVIITHKSFEFICLYFFLFFSGLIPFNLVRFLNQTAEHTGLIEKDGGQWRFRHKLIQDELARRWEVRGRK